MIGNVKSFAPGSRQVPTVLGREVRRRAKTMVNGLSRGVRIEVNFVGKRAYTNGKRIVLPNIRDMAEIKYATSRALLGYAVHEVAHIRYTDFGAIERIFMDRNIADSFGTDDKKEIQTRLKLIKKFENCIEDYRIEREMTREYPGTKSDLEALRTAIHPKLSTLTTGWFRDPRSCGPLALTWTGARINGFANPHLDRTLDFVDPPVLAMILEWTDRMTDVDTTAEAVELAIEFEAESQAYAKATRDAAEKAREKLQSNPDEDVPADAGEGETSPIPNDGEREEGEKSDETSDLSGSQTDQDDQSTDDGQQDDDSDDGDLEASPGSEDADSDAADDDAEKGDEESGDKGDADEAGKGDDADEAGKGDDATDDKSAENVDDRSDVDTQEDDKGGNPDAGGKTDEDGTSRDASSGSDQDDGQADEQEVSFGDDKRPDAKKETEGKSDDGTDKRRSSPSDDGKVDLNSDLVDEYDESEMGGGSGDDDEDAVDELEKPPAAEDDAPREGPAKDEPEDGMDALENEPSKDDGSSGPEQDEAPGGAFDDVLDENAGMEDAVSDAIQAELERREIEDPLPEQTPEGTEADVDPESILSDISDSNEEAPDYDSSDSDADPNDFPEQDAAPPSIHHYGDARFSKAPALTGERNLYESLRSKAAGAISTTSRTIKRLLMAEEKSGTITNRRSGDFDIRNISAIARGTGTCYRKNWTRPAPKTLLVTLVDFSGSMKYDDDMDFDAPDFELATPIALAMTGALAIEQAVKGTSVNSAIYGYTGYSPTVNLTIFKEGVQQDQTTRNRIGAFTHVDMVCTPTGEAMAAVAQRMDDAEEERRVLLVLTDGDADNPQLCADVSRVLIRRGIEVIVIGIKNDSAEGWAPVHHMINDISELPGALLTTIDPRAARRNMRKAA